MKNQGICRDVNVTFTNLLVSIALTSHSITGFFTYLIVNVSVNVKARINARKIVLVYFYEQYFLEIAATKDSLLDEIDKIHKVVDQKGPAKEDVNMR